MWQTDQVPGVKQLLHGLSLVQADANNHSLRYGGGLLSLSVMFGCGDPPRGCKRVGIFLENDLKLPFPSVL